MQRDIPRHLITNTHYNRRSSISSEIDRGYTNLYIAIFQQGVKDEIAKARTQLGYRNSLGKTLKEGDISDELKHEINQIIAKDAFIFPDYKIYGEGGRIEKYPDRLKHHDYVKINAELERRKL